MVEQRMRARRCAISRASAWESASACGVSRRVQLRLVKLLGGCCAR
jgi:hypothetical protein